MKQTKAQKEAKKLKEKSFNSMLQYLGQMARVGEFEICWQDEHADVYVKELQDRYSYMCMLNSDLEKKIKKLESEKNKK
jgi:hypothetical protein